MDQALIYSQKRSVQFLMMIYTLRKVFHNLSPDQQLLICESVPWQKKDDVSGGQFLQTPIR